MIIRVEVHTAGAERMLLMLRRDQLPYAKSVALNEVATRFQAAQRRGIHERFRTRRKQWVDQSVKITHFARKQEGRAYAEIGIVSPGGGERSDILGKFEKGGLKRPKAGSRLAVPDEARRTKSDIVQKSQRPRAFNFKLHGVGPKAEVLIGDKRTFMIRRPDGTGAVYQRTGARRRIARDNMGRNLGGRRRRARSSVLKRLFVFTRTARLDPDLRFHETARRVVAAEWPPAFREAFRKAIATAR